MEETDFDRWVKRRSARYNSEPRWQRAVGNFGFGFVFIGALTNLAVVMFLIATTTGIDFMYQPWWPAYVLFSSMGGLYWTARRHRFHTTDA